MQRWIKLVVVTMGMATGCGRVTEPARRAWDQAQARLPAQALVVEVPEIAEVAEVAEVTPARMLSTRVAAPVRARAADPARSQQPGSRRVTEAAVVFAAPDPEAPMLGLLAAGTHVGVYGSVDDGAACEHGRWWAVAPAGFVCAPTRASTKAPTTTMLPHVPQRAVTPGVYGKVRDGAPVYASRSDAQMGLPTARPEGSLTVERLRGESIDGRKFWLTRAGWIAAADIRRHRPSSFAGVSLRGEDAPTLPLAWTSARPGAERSSVAVLVEPRAGAKEVRRLRARTRVSVGETVGRFVAVDGGWVDARDLRIARAADTAPTVQPGEKWIDIDLQQQTLVAYEGDTPVYVTLVSTGRAGHRTPTGVFRIERKVAERTMNSMSDSDETYRVAKVPWTSYFSTGYALHAAYWHDGFGRPRSHGCVNLAPRDAQALYAWSGPSVAPGWTEAYGHLDQPGSVVRVRSKSDPTPAVQGYARAWLPQEAPTEDDGRVAAAPHGADPRPS